jgi:ribulose-phosphate 3-epimerase
MIDEPVGKLAPFVDAGATTITFQVEATRHAHRALQELAGAGITRGVALNPELRFAAVEPLLEEIELLLVLAVNPDWSGQRFISATVRKLAAARDLIGDREVMLAVDRGITRSNVEHVLASGVDLIVTGSAVFDGVDPAENARAMVHAVRRSRAGVTMTGVTKEG